MSATNPPIVPPLAPAPGWRWGGLAVVALLLLSRDPYRLFSAQLWAEDGPVWLYGAYMHGLSALLRPHTGYLQTLPRLVAALAVLPPLRFAPTIFAAAGFLIQLIPVALLLSRRGEILLPSLMARLLLVFFYVGVPNSSETYINLTDAQWHYAIVTFMLLLLPPPRHLVARLAELSALAIGGLSGPFAVLLTPIAWLEAWRRRGAAANLTRAAIVTVTALIQLGYIFAQTAPSDRLLAPLGAGLGTLSRILANQIFMGGLIGINRVAAFAQAPAWHDRPTWPILCAATGLIITAVAAWRGPPVYRMFLLYAGLIIGAALASPVASSVIPQWAELEVPGSGSRYYLLPILAWFAAVLVLAAQPTKALRWPARLLLVAFLAGIVADWRYDRQLVTNYDTVARGFAAAPPGTVTVFPEDPDPRVWVFSLTKF